jgi:tRNA pseudouridine38-40 synthase
MAVIRLDLAYDGSGFHGYARQDGLRTVQGELEAALRTVLGRVPETAVAGRTDAGVHAVGQVVSFPDESRPDLAELQRSLNGLLGPEIAIWAASFAEDRFHARHSALWRRYEYRIGTRPGGNPLTRGHTWEVGRSLDTGAMGLAAAELLGEHDFTSFCRSVDGASNVRRVDESGIDLTADGVVTYRVVANAFCHQMVRSIIGHLYDIGRGFSRATDVASVLMARDRARVATVAPPHGLTLFEVGYDTR